MRRYITIPLTFQGCTGDQLCQRRYHPLIGYYAGVSPTASYEIYCATHFPRLLYGCAYDAKRGLQYACPVPGCEYGATVIVFLPPEQRTSPPKKDRLPRAGD